MPVEKILSFDTFSPGRNNLREANCHIGERFGLVVVTDVIMRDCGKIRRSYALCDCDCGVKNKEILLTKLVTGKQKSCGCKRGGSIDLNSDESPSKKYSIKGIVGKRFDRLIVQEVIKGKTNEGAHTYKLRCLCDCGNKTIINVSHIGRVKSCGCLHKEAMREKRIDLTKENMKKVKDKAEEGFPFWEKVPDSQFLGKQSHNLKIVEVRRKSNISGGYIQYARCICDCGKETVKLLSNVTTGHTKSCGCAKVVAANNMSQKNSLEGSGTRFCKIGDTFGGYTVIDIFKRKNNIYAKCNIDGKEKDIRADRIPGIKKNLNTCAKSS
jgi:hypothetical protein